MAQEAMTREQLISLIVGGEMSRTGLKRQFSTRAVANVRKMDEIGGHRRFVYFGDKIVALPRAHRLEEVHGLLAHAALRVEAERAYSALDRGLARYVG